MLYILPPAPPPPLPTIVLASMNTDKIECVTLLSITIFKPGVQLEFSRIKSMVKRVHLIDYCIGKEAGTHKNIWYSAIIM